MSDAFGFGSGYDPMNNQSNKSSQGYDPVSGGPSMGKPMPGSAPGAPLERIDSNNNTIGYNEPVFGGPIIDHIKGPGYIDESISGPSTRRPDRGMPQSDYRDPNRLGRDSTGTPWEINRGNNQYGLQKYGPQDGGTAFYEGNPHADLGFDSNNTASMDAIISLQRSLHDPGRAYSDQMAERADTTVNNNPKDYYRNAALSGHQAFQQVSNMSYDDLKKYITADPGLKQSYASFQQLNSTLNDANYNAAYDTLLERARDAGFI